MDKEEQKAIQEAEAQVDIDTKEEPEEITVTKEEDGWLIKKGRQYIGKLTDRELRSIGVKIYEINS